MALISTIKGDIDESLLLKTEGGHDNDTETVKWVQYELDGEVVRRDVDMVLKKGLSLFADAASF